jgi:hypothetical protein
MSERLVHDLHASTIAFGPEDVDILDLVLHLRPELRICAEAVRQARLVGLEYPVTSVDDIFEMWRTDLGPRFPGVPVAIARDDVRQLFPPEVFPINDEAELIVRTNFAIHRCSYLAAQRFTDEFPNDESNE